MIKKDTREKVVHQCDYKQTFITAKYLSSNMTCSNWYILQSGIIQIRFTRNVTFDNIPCAKLPLQQPSLIPIARATNTPYTKCDPRKTGITPKICNKASHWLAEMSQNRTITNDTACYCNSAKFEFQYIDN